MHLLPAVDLVLATFSAFVHSPQRASSGITTADDLILLDAPAFSDPANPTYTLASFDAFVFTRQVHIEPTVRAIQALLTVLGIHVGDSLENLTNRAKLFAAKGLENKSIDIIVDGCEGQISLSKTAGLPDRGLFNQNVSIGVCNAQSQLNGFVANATVVLPSSDDREISSNVFFYPNSGFGVISDVDDTVKITHVLHPPAMLKATFLDDPVPVSGMPELYASLAQNLSPDFLYVSGSMLQIQPFLRDFIHTTYSASKGPLFLRNLTNISDIINFVQSDGIFEYKSAIIDQIKGMYPNKRFLAVGDSTQKDPETYGEAYRKYGDFIMCAWIRLVDGADNTAARFAAAFDGVPSNRWRAFDDSDIAGLASINVAAGDC
ncbi:hypothetical protein APHAL10511_004630 [Amanita phalloides]|nr:hypothetical protein APHAL10511_004630 [Amanita phalloides]